MRIYMAAFYHNSAKMGTSWSVHKRITEVNYIYPWILESYHYMSRLMLQSMRQHNRTVFMDSGAFTAFTLGEKLDLNRYARFLREYRDIYHVASNIDVIGRDKEQETYDNQKKLENLIGPGVVMPVHHVRDSDDWLRRYMDEGYDYIFLGGMVPESVPVLRQWLDYVWGRYLTNDDGTAKLKVHGFGLTTEELMFRYPWFSVDSSQWLMESSFGGCNIDLPQASGEVKTFKIDFSEHSPSRYGIDSRHFGSLAKAEQDVIRQRLAELDASHGWQADQRLKEDFKIETGVDLAYTPEALGKSYGLRRILNMDFWARAAESRTNVFTHMQETLF